jgi:N-methylhydantoinase B
MITNLLSSGIEPEEALARELSLGFQVLPDSGGPGRRRGGAATISDTYWRVPTDQLAWCFHVKTPMAGGGVYGGRPGTLATIWTWDDPARAGMDISRLDASVTGDIYRSAETYLGRVDPSTNEAAADGSYHFMGTPRPTPAGAFTRCVTNGSGGWGNPFERDPHLVLIDVRDEYVSIAGAARDYGVVVRGDPQLDPEGLTIDLEATARLRTGRTDAPNRAPQPAASAGALRHVPTTAVQREAVEGACPECASCSLERYPVLGDGGWFVVVKCQACLASLSRMPWHRLGWVTLEGVEAP